MTSFDRIKPPERRLLERDGRRRPDAPDADREGRAGLFTAGAPNAVPGALLHLECGWCGEVGGVDAAGALRRALPLFLVVPWRRHPIFAVCPCGQRRAWLRPRLRP